MLSAGKGLDPVSAPLIVGSILPSRSPGRASLRAALPSGTRVGSSGLMKPGPVLDAVRSISRQCSWDLSG
jgi:hypothetical protein